MKLLRFSGRGIHGLFDLDTVEFFPDVTFLTGINGSGKTTTIFAITSLLRPSLRNLARVRHESFSLIIENGTIKIEIQSKNDGKTVTLGVGSDTISFPILPVTNEYQSGSRFLEEEEEYYKRIDRDHQNTPAIQTLKKLPTPMFLDLERLHYEEWERPEGNVWRPNSRRTKHSFYKSLEESNQLANSSNRDIQVQIRKLAENFRKKIIEATLDVELKRREEFKLLEDKEIDRTVESASKALEQIGILGKKDELASFFREMNEAKIVYDRLNNNPDGVKDEEMEQVYKWYEHQGRYEQLLKYLSLAVEHSDAVEGATRPIDEYKNLINQFLIASRKELFFDDQERLRLKIDNTIPAAPWLNSLSSGEGQLFTLLTNLKLGKETERSKVCIIDEPEVSLHVIWQESFVTAIQKANPSIQLILATHSPSIINGDNEHCRTLKLVRSAA